MKRISLTIFLITTLSNISQSEISHGIDMDALRRFSEEDRKQATQETALRDGPDKPWLFVVLKKVHEGKEVSDDELRRVWEIYRAEKNHTPADKLIAFRLITEVEDNSKWQKEFDAFAYSDDPQFVKTSIQTLFWKLDRGTEREKITLSNKTAVLKHLVQFAVDNRFDTTIDRETPKLLELTKPYSGKTPPPEIQRPDRRHSGSLVEVISEPIDKTHKSSALGSLVRMFAKNGSLVIVGTIGVIFAAFLIWRWKSKSTH